MSGLLCMSDLGHASTKASMDDLLKGEERPENLLYEAGLIKELKIKGTSDQPVRLRRDHDLMVSEGVGRVVCG